MSRLSETPAGVKLGPLNQIADKKARNFVLQIGENYFHGFIVRDGDEARGFVDRCPHMGVPLARELDDYLTPDGKLIACAWHGALFEIADGTCVGGPCAGQKLTPWPIRVNNGTLETL